MENGMEREGERERERERGERGRRERWRSSGGKCVARTVERIKL